MHVIRAKTAGFCMGVALALKKLEDALEDHEGGNTRIFTLGPIIHNPQVLEDYARRGVGRLRTAEEAGQGQCVLIRAHGIPRQEEQSLRLRGAEVIDATCPKVKKAQLAIAGATRAGDAQDGTTQTQESQEGRCLLLFGEADHPEVRGLVSYAEHGAHVFDSLEELRALPLTAEGRYVLASQTTQDRRLFDNIEAWLREKVHDLPVLSTICDATRHRQDEALDLASRVDMMVVVGGRDSGNTRRLADVAAARGVPTWHVETVDELKTKNFAPHAVVGLTAGASTPKSLIDAVQVFLKSIA